MNYEVERVYHESQSGYRCAVIITELGHRCGYVGIPHTHFLHGCEYNMKHSGLWPYAETIYYEPVDRDKISIIALFCDPSPIEPEIIFRVHGGITFSSADPEYPVPNNNLWWFGFDCAHAGDAPIPERVPPELRAFRIGGGEVRSLDYCMNECNGLARQLYGAQNLYLIRQEILHRQYTLT